MGIIKCLDNNLMNLIAAGEVVERPSGVVKELVDNAIDAKATKITIDVKNGGIDLIKISDDGIGMSYEDSIIAFERHATSKISEMKDLWSINSLGFRGEALPSIAAVSKVSLKTSNSQEGSCVEIDYGTLKKHELTAANQGTIIEVKNLFQKVPARLKYLKNPNYEFALINDVVDKFALAYPNIAFKLMHNDKVVLKTNGNGNLQQVIMAVMGRDVAKNSIEVSFKDDDYQVEGYIIQPSITRATGNYINLFVNNRMIKAYKLNKVIKEAYKEYIPSDRFPICFLNIEMDPRLVDVNVHPSKWEVKFSKEKNLMDLLNSGIQKALENFFNPQQITLKDEVAKNDKIAVEEQVLDLVYSKEPTNTVNNELSINKNAEMLGEKVENSVYEVVEDTTLEKINEQDDKHVVEDSKKRILDELQVIGQLSKAYILAQSPNGLVIIDQHAAQERYHFEEISKSINNNNIHKQHLLMPLKISINNKVSMLFEEVKTSLSELGMDVELFGNDSMIVREVPTWMSYLDEEGFIQDLLDLFAENGKVDSLALRRHALATAACHSSIRFNRTLTISEMQQVIEDLKKCDQPFSCPHGRPTLIEYTLKDLEKSFLRVK